jgi:Uma2 family endonuclease
MTMTTTERSSVMIPADRVPGPKQGRWTYQDYAAIPEDGHRYEVVRGVLYMSPAPSPGHQSSVARFVYYLMEYVEFKGLGRVFVSPTDVELSPGDIVQPDVFVVLNAHLNYITSTRIIGVPDLAIELASPSTARYDLNEKLNVYAHAGVPEYWIANPDARTVEVLKLEGSEFYSLGLFSGSATLPSLVVPDLPVRVEQFFV